MIFEPTLLQEKNMNNQTPDIWYPRVLVLLQQRRIIDALDKLGTIARAGDSSAILPQLDELRFMYGNMLNYTVKGVNDPKQELIYKRLLSSVYTLADKLHQIALEQRGSRIIAMKRDMENELRRERLDMSESLQGLYFDHELDEMLRSTELFSDETESDAAVRHRQSIFKIFNQLWLSDNLSEDDATMVLRFFNSDSIPWFEKAIMVSALTMGLLRVFDARRLQLLAELYRHPEPRINQRALVGLLIAFAIYDDRIQLSDNLVHSLEALNEQTDFKAEALSVVIQFIRATDTEKITRKFHDEVIPDIIRFNEDLSEKLNLDTLMTTDEFEDKNPDWEKYFDNQPGLVQKLEEMTNMQMEGGDVFLGAFAMLKSFPFFNALPNWFMPFYPEHFEVQKVLNHETEAFREAMMLGIGRSVYLCNSDKFSFVFNLNRLPDAQKRMMGQMFAAEAEQIQELLSEELSDPALHKKRIVIQYIQDLYRFFKLHPIRNEVADLFNPAFRIHRSGMFTHLVTGVDFYKQVAAFYFDNGHYEQALELYLMFGASGEAYAELFEKTAYCYQQLGEYTLAIEYYKKADLFDTNRAWLLGKIARCYLKLDKTREALEVWLELAEMEPDNNRVASAIGTCYLNLGETDKALEYFYRIEFAEPGSPKAMRPVAWCLFILNRPRDAERYYEQLLELEPNAFDYMNAGHVALTLNKIETAAQHYINSIRLRDNDIRTFLRGFASDRKYLLNNKVDEALLPLVIDYVRYSLRK
ncbi:tetratricopeptide repeat protein [Lentimicrobium sp.]